MRFLGTYSGHVGDGGNDDSSSPEIHGVKLDVQRDSRTRTSYAFRAGSLSHGSPVGEFAEGSPKLGVGGPGFGRDQHFHRHAHEAPGRVVEQPMCLVGCEFDGSLSIHDQQRGRDRPKDLQTHIIDQRCVHNLALRGVPNGLQSSSAQRRWARGVGSASQ